MIPSSFPSAFSCIVGKGKSAVFENYDEAGFDIEKYSEAPLFNSTYNYYPGVITLEPACEPNIGVDGISDHQSLITYGIFTIDKTTNVLNLKPIKQTLIAFEIGFNLQQIYGMEDALEENKENAGMVAGVDYDTAETAHQGVVGISEEKNTVVMPGGHLGVCKDGAVAISKQKTPDCPICRK